jgi:hypothetical protein
MTEIRVRNAPLSEIKRVVGEGHTGDWITLGRPKRGGIEGVKAAAQDPTFPDGWGISRVQDMLQQHLWALGKGWKKRGYPERAVLGFSWLGISAVEVLGAEGCDGRYRLIFSKSRPLALMLGASPDGTLLEPILLDVVGGEMSVEWFQAGVMHKFTEVGLLGR